MLRQLSLFAGIEGFGLAGSWVNWKLVASVEIDKWCQKVIKKNFPETEIYGDIKKFDASKFSGSIDIVTGGFPCQPFSVSGKKEATDDYRYLWPEMFRVIQQVRPPFVVAENVFGIVGSKRGMVLQKICTDLEGEGYEIQPVIIPACAVNAPHKRDRIWFVGYNGKFATNAHGIGLQSAGKKSKRSISKENIVKDTDSLTLPEAENTSAFFTNSASFRRRKNNRGRESGFFNQKSKIDYWKNFPTQSPVCLGNDGLSDRLDRTEYSKWRNKTLKGAGNAIVPHVFYQIAKVITLMFID